MTALKNEHSYYRDYVSSLPEYLSAFAEPQNYDQYTPENQAVWRFIMKNLTEYFKDKAPEAYFSGLERAAIPVDRIPRIEEMIEGLREIGWGAICVNGFIPPAAFMEYNANKILPISADMRSLKTLLYTPAPDIVHEAAGHAPIVADPEYTDFLQKVGEYGAKALSNKYDQEVYEAIRELSIVKEFPNSTPKEIKEAEERLERAVVERKNHPLSEASLVSRFHWWTVEYGLLKREDGMRMYGAGLLSSLGESFNCLNDSVKKIKLSIDALNTDYDITTEQPQLFYVESSKDLFPVLEELADRMAFRRGGVESLDKAVEGNSLATCNLDSGLQISGSWSEVLKDQWGEAIYIKTQGPTSLAYQNTELLGHGKEYHSAGFSTPLGKLKGDHRSLKELDYKELDHRGIERGKFCELEFESGVLVKGRLTDIVSRCGENILFSFKDCTVTGPEGQTLFLPDWGMYDMGIGEKITSVFGGPADKKNYDFIDSKSENKTLKVEYSPEKLREFEIYNLVRDFRNSGSEDFSLLKSWFNELKSIAPENWLLNFEMLELCQNKDKVLEKDLRLQLEHQEKLGADIKHLINLGLNLL